MKSAIVVGGGIAGLAAAQVLSERFDKVQVYEGDEPAQSHHLHVLLKSGQDALERIFPGIRQQLQLKGCPQIDWALDTVWENQDGEFPRYESSVRALSLSRILLNQVMRDMINKLRIEFKQEKILSLDGLNADLIVLAGGQHFPLARFIGRDSYNETNLPINLTYRSYLFLKEDLNLKGMGQYYFQIDPPVVRIGGVISPIEENKVIVTLIEHEESYSSCSTYEDFLAKAKGIPSDNFQKILQEARPISGPHFYRKKTTHRRKILSLPANVIVLGDTLMSLNPVFGQGMTVALKEVELFQEMLGKDFVPMAFQAKCETVSTLSYHLSHLGSQEMGIGKTSLRSYLRLCQKSKAFHHLFLKQLHFLKVFPRTSL